MTKNINPLWVAILFASLSASFSFGATITWVNTSGGDWNVAANWNPSQVPTNTDTALITNSGTYTVTINSTAAANVLTLGGVTGTQTLLLSSGRLNLGAASTGNAQAVVDISFGTLGGAGSLLLAGPLIWGDGTITNSVQFNGGSFSNSLDLNGGQVINTGTLNCTASSISTGNGSVISNAPTGTINVNANLSQGFLGGTHTTINAGQIVVAVPGTVNFFDTFTNTGSVIVNGGILDFSGGGTSSGSIAVAPVATVDFSSGTFSITGGSLSGDSGNFTVSGATVTVGVGLDMGGTWTFSGGTTTLSSTSVSGNAVIISGGNVSFGGTGPWQPGTLTFTFGTLEGTSPVTVQNVNGMAWGGGTILSNLVQFNGGSISNGIVLNAGEVINTGTVDCTASSISTGDGSIISNAPTGIINVNANLSQGFLGGTHIFNNAGQLNVSVSGTVSLFDTFTNTGSVTINGGILDFTGGGTSSGSITAASGTTLDFPSGTFSINSGTLSGAGSFAVSGGTVTVGVGLDLGGTWTFSGGTTTLSSTSVSGNAVIISGGNVFFNGTGPWQPGTLAFTFGTLEGTTPVTVQTPNGMAWGGGTILSNLVQFDGGSFSNGIVLNAGEVINTGTVNCTASSISTGDGSIISNAPTGIINVSANLSQGFLGGTHIFDNAGQLDVAVSGTASLFDTFINTGSVTVNGGTLELSGGGTSSGSITAVSTTTLDFPSGTFSVNSGTLSGAGNFTVGGGTVTVGVGLNLGGTWTFSGGTATLNGSTTVSGNAVIISGGNVFFDGTGPWQPGTLALTFGTIEGTTPVTVEDANGIALGGGTILTNRVQFNGGVFSNSFVVNAGEVINTGTVNCTATSIGTGNGSIISNAPGGVVNLTANLSEGFEGGARTIYNAGQLNVAVPGTVNFGDAFTNTGTITINGGILDLSGSHSLAGGTLVFGINALNNYGSSTLAGAAGLAGTLKSTFNGSYLPSVGNSYTNITYGSSSGNFTATNLSPLAIWTVNQNATALSITVVKLVPQVSWNTSDFVYGDVIGSQVFATANWNGTNVPGVITYISPVSGTVLDSGSNQTLSVAFVPTDPSTFASVTNNLVVNVQMAPLGVTANNTNKTYGQTITFAGTEFTTSGLVNGDSVTSATLSSAGAPATAAVAGSPYTITINSAVGDAGLTNYIITYTNGLLTVNKALLTITADSTNKIAGESLTFAGTEFTSSGLQNSETIGSVTLTSTGAPAGAGAGGYPIVPSAPTGGTFSQGNYTDTFDNGTLTVIGVPSLSIGLHGTQDILTFQAIPGQSYQVQSTTNLTTAMTPLGPAISNTNGAVNVTNSISAPQTFYRLQIQLAP